MGIKFSHLYQKLFPLSRKNSEDPDEFSSLFPKVDTDTQKTDYVQEYGGLQCDKSNDCTKVDKSMASYSAKEWHPALDHHTGLLIPLIKYFMFFFNFVISIISFLMLGFGVWGLLDKQSLMRDRIGHLGSDPMFLFIMVGLTVSVLSVSGCVGFIRENICLLKVFSAGISVLIIIQLLSVIFALSFRDHIQNSVRSSMVVALTRYQDDSDLRFIMDEIQLGMECCGIQSYQDWALSQYFNCSSPGVYSCGVPYSCCIDPFENGTVINSQCGVGSLRMGETMAGSLIYLGGCVPQLALWLQRSLWDITAVFLLVIAIEFMCVLCAQTMSREIKNIKSNW